MGTRVRMKVPCVWPERAGSVGTIVAAPVPGKYPDGSGAIVLLDDDLLVPADGDSPFGGRPDGWTCVMDSAVLEVLDA